LVFLIPVVLYSYRIILSLIKSWTTRANSK
jgi:hypothetical protein